MIGCLFLLIIGIYLFPFSFAGKEKGKGIYVIIGRTGRASLLPGRFPAVYRRYSLDPASGCGMTWCCIGVRYDKGGYSWIPHRSAG